jgi:hypothetical protein
LRKSEHVTSDYCADFRALSAIAKSASGFVTMSV